jgi:hypothetical protein
MRGLYIAAVLALALLAGCATTIVPPAVPDTVDVFLLDHGRTTSLVVPAPDNRMVRYAYGDWNWYALGNTGAIDGLRALVGPTPAAFGRQDLRGPANETTIRSRFLPAYIVNLHAVPVGRREADALRTRLDALHRKNRAIAVATTNEFVFVPDARPYSYFHNSNHVVAQWLRELGCETRGPAFSSEWRVALH